MDLTALAINDLAPFVTGNNDFSIPLKGPKLVTLFNQYGFRDTYDFDNGGLPPKNKGERNMSRTEYVKNRLNEISGSPQLRSLLETVINSSENKETCANRINEILSQEGYKVELVSDYYVIVGGKIIQTLEIKNHAYFLNIQNQILEKLDKARVSISIAMAWFTNDTLYQKLMEKKKQGVRIEMVIYNDGVNSKYGIDFSQFDTVKIRSARGGIMHNKFCIIDNQIVITGSYNWSDNAEFKHEENITVIENLNIATEYSVKFIKLKQQGAK